MGDGVGLAARGFVKMPTADEDKGLGTGKTSFGADLILSKHLGHAADIHGVDRLPVEQRSRRRGDRRTPSSGPSASTSPPAAPSSCRPSSWGRNYSGDDDFEQTESPRPRGGPRLLDQGASSSGPRISWNLNFERPRPGLELQELDRPSHLDRLAPRHRLPRDRGPAAAAAAAANSNPTVNCEVERSQILPGETVRREGQRLRRRRRHAHLRVEREPGPHHGPGRQRDLRQHRRDPARHRDHHRQGHRRTRRHRPSRPARSASRPRR